MVKLAVSIPDDLHEWAEQECEARGISRSALYAEGLRRLRGKPYDTDVAAKMKAAANALSGDEYSEAMSSFARRNAKALDLGE